MSATSGLSVAKLTKFSEQTLHKQNVSYTFHVPYDSPVHEGKHSTEVKNTGFGVRLFGDLKPILLPSN